MSNVEQIIEDIKSLKVQGATNVAKACLEGIKMFSNTYEGNSTEEFLSELKTVAWKLASARPTEPLARNLVRYVLENIKCTNISDIRDVQLEDLIMSSYQILESAKHKMVENGVDLLNGVDALLTHCHSSTATNIIIGIHKNTPDLKVYATETRPKFQGRITAKELVDAGINTTMIVDSASSMFIVADKHPDVDAVILGCDEITIKGDAINKIGSMDIAIACQYKGIPLYVASTLLKLDLYDEDFSFTIEGRDAHEVWPEAPANLKIINPAFELVPNSLIKGFITESGIVIPQEIKIRAEEVYPWMKGF
jgi:ribose 1,5-bisphosphate isomerase